MSNTTTIKHFCKQLIKHSQFKSKRNFVAGSFVEIPQQALGFKKFCASWRSLLDMDRMLYFTSSYAFPLSQSVPEAYIGQVIRFCSDGQHRGYTKLYCEKGNHKITVSDIGFNIKPQYRHGPAEREPLGTLSNGMTTLTDVVYSVHCPYWPVEAYEWVTRQRPHGLPSQSTIKEVVRYGCDFVQVSHNRVNSDPTEWRFSFSKAELIIIRSWTTVSEDCLPHTSHTVFIEIKSRMDKTALCTYYFKTLMLWATEEKPPEFWYEHVLIDSVCELLFAYDKLVERKVLSKLLYTK